LTFRPDKSEIETLRFSYHIEAHGRSAGQDGIKSALRLYLIDEKEGASVSFTLPDECGGGTSHDLLYLAEKVRSMAGSKNIRLEARVKGGSVIFELAYGTVHCDGNGSFELSWIED
jgi:hypothetical protein